MGSPTARPAIAPWWADSPHPVRLSIVLVAVPVLISVAIGVGGALVDPSADGWVSRLIAVLATMTLALLVVARSRAWRRTATAGPRTWRHLGLLVVPALIALAPLVTGIRLPPASLLVILVCGYIATGIFEEVWHRGVVLDTLRRLGLRRSAVIGGALFALSHFANVAFGQSVAVTAAQGVGAFCFGIGFAIYRWRTNAVWVLAGIHAAGDLLFKITGLHGGLLWGFLVGHDTLMLLWALWCLRGVEDNVAVGSTDQPG